MSRRLIPVKYEFVADHLPPGLPADEVHDFLKSQTYQRRLPSLITRRGFIFGAASAAVPLPCANPTADASVAALIPAVITAVDLATKLWDLYQKIRGDISLNNRKDNPSQGEVEQTVRNSRFIESSGKLVVEIPADVNITINFVGPGATSKQANQFVSRTAVSTVPISIKVQ
ncbi:hypothetical protein [Microvirga subterranea]|uniref:hypothetical protein n=1 Tax=Microvirga subterranea TaxID=186651 RepID=UPI0011C06F75|nr:hypothetical protein [Microvirga subterranea]